MTKATKHIRDAAQRCINGRIIVDSDSLYNTVCISVLGFEDIFMQGDEAEKFIAERDALCRRYPSLDEGTAELALAEPYIECLCN
jgi:hypothetical protein